MSRVCVQCPSRATDDFPLTIEEFEILDAHLTPALARIWIKTSDPEDPNNSFKIRSSARNGGHEHRTGRVAAGDYLGSRRRRDHGDMLRHVVRDADKRPDGLRRIDRGRQFDADQWGRCDLRKCER